jgi:hypothetical protein
MQPKTNNAYSPKNKWAEPIPTTEENLANTLSALADWNIDSSIKEFGKAITDEVDLFCGKHEGIQFVYHDHRHMTKGLAVLFKIKTDHYLWMTLFPRAQAEIDAKSAAIADKEYRKTNPRYAKFCEDNPDSLRASPHRATVTTARKSTVAKEALAICSKPDEAAKAIIGEIKRIYKIIGA